MELFEILFILFFILIPLFEGIRKSRQRTSGDLEVPDEPDERPSRVGRPDPAPPRYEPRDPEPEPVEAADMIPDDLWEILTGERRQRSSTVEAPPEPEPLEEPQETPWWEDPTRDLEPVPEHGPPPRAARPPHRERDPWAIEPSPPQPPEALVVPDEAPRRAPRRPTVHRRREEPPRPPRATSPLMQALREPGGLRQAVLLREILGPPGGLADS